MVCPVCKTEAVISKSSYGYHIDGDKVEMFMLMKYSCRNKKCSEFQKEIGEDKIPLNAEPIE